MWHEHRQALTLFCKDSSEIGKPIQCSERISFAVGRVLLNLSFGNTPSFDLTLRNIAQQKSWNPQVDESLHKMSLSTEYATALLSFKYPRYYYHRQQQQDTIFADQFYFASRCHFTSSLEVESVRTFGHKFGWELWLDDSVRQRKLYLAIL